MSTADALRVLIQAKLSDGRLLTNSIPRVWGGPGGPGTGEKSDCGMIATMILDAPMCPQCLARKTGMSADEINAVLRSIATYVRLAVGKCRCAACLQQKTTFTISTAKGSGGARIRGGQKTDGLRLPA